MTRRVRNDLVQRNAGMGSPKVSLGSEIRGERSDKRKRIRISNIKYAVFKALDKLDDFEAPAQQLR